MSKTKTYKEKPPTTPWYRVHGRDIEVLDVVRETEMQLVVVSQSFGRTGWVEWRYQKEASNYTCFPTAEEAARHLRRRLVDLIADGALRLERDRERLTQLNAKFPPKE